MPKETFRSAHIDPLQMIGGMEDLLQYFVRFNLGTLQWRQFVLL